MPEVSWRTHPWRRRPLRGAFGLLTAGAALALVQAAGGSPPLTAAGALLLFSQLWPFYLPVRYRVDQEGILIDNGLWRRRRRWAEFRSWQPLPEGALVSPFARACRRDRWRALWLPCRPEMAAQVGEALSARLPRREAAP